MPRRDIWRSLDQPHTWVLLSIMVASVVRLVYGLAVNDPLGGPDADTYHAAGTVMAERGPFADDIPGVPYWPAGYPAMVAAVYALVGASPRALVPLQVLLLGVATYSAYRLAAEELNERVGIVTALLLCASPALVAAPTVLMYEIPLAAALSTGFLMLSRARTSSRALSTALLAGLLLAVAAALQPKALLPTLFGAGLLAVTSKRRLAAALVFVISLSGPAALAGRTWVAEGEPVAAATLGITMRIGMRDEADGGYQPTPAPDAGDAAELAASDRELIRQAVQWAAEDPGRALALTGPKAWNFWSPLAGSEGSRGTWFHALDARRAVPKHVVPANAWSTLRAAWTIGTVGLVAAGAALAWRSRRAGAVLIAIPVLSFLVISLVSIGDPRFRIPVTPFYTTFIAAVIVSWLDRRRRRTCDEPRGSTLIRSPCARAARERSGR